MDEMKQWARKKRERNLCAHVICACKTRASQVAFKLC